jgi:hypothetical protein
MFIKKRKRKKKVFCWDWWCMPLILATQEAGGAGRREETCAT